MFSPMEGFVNYSIFSYKFEMTNINLYLLIILGIILFINTINRTKSELIVNQNNWQILEESLYRTILALIENNIGKNYQQYLPLFYSVFMLIFCSNFIGLIPYSKSPSVELIITLSLAFTLLIGNLIVGFLNHKLYLLAVFIPAGCPTLLIPLMIVLEILAYVFRTISLGLRLAINIMTGKILCAVIVGFIQDMYSNGVSFLIILLPLSFLTLYISLEILICYLQAYIFLFITCLTFKDLALAE